MPLTYTNRKGVTYTLYRSEGQPGIFQYVFARKSDGEPVAEMPPGFHISESPNGLVSLVKDRPALILPEEVAAVEAEVAEHPHAGQFRVVVKPDRIEIHAKEGYDHEESYREMQAAGLIKGGIPKRVREIDELLTRYVLMLRFILGDAQARSFRAEGRQERGHRYGWLKLGRAGEIGELASAYVPNLGAYTFHGFYSATVAEPWRDAIKKRAARRDRKRLTSIHRLKVSLRDIRPQIWRRIAVPSDITLGELHEIVQETMGWDDYHLHEFRIGDARYGDPRQLEELLDQDEWKARLAQVAPAPKSRIRYLYDFGDGWEHEIVVEAVGSPELGVRYPVCLTGKRASPPEDSGGPWRYEYITQLMADPTNPDPEALEEFLEWMGGPFDPEAFDPDDVNRRLARLS